VSTSTSPEAATLGLSDSELVKLKKRELYFNSAYTVLKGVVKITSYTLLAIVAGYSAGIAQAKYQEAAALREGDRSQTHV
jgi:hypothetical protein